MVIPILLTRRNEENLLGVLPQFLRFDWPFVSEVIARLSEDIMKMSQTNQKLTWVGSCVSVVRWSLEGRES